MLLAKSRLLLLPRAGVRAYAAASGGADGVSFKLTEQQKEFQKTARQFAAEHMIPNVRLPRVVLVVLRGWPGSVQTGRGGFERPAPCCRPWRSTP